MLELLQVTQTGTSAIFEKSTSTAGSSTTKLIAVFVMLLIVGGAAVDRKSSQTISAALQPLEWKAQTRVGWVSQNRVDPRRRCL